MSEEGFRCPKCGEESGDSWVQCEGECPMPMSPHYIGAWLPLEKTLRQKILNVAVDLMGDFMYHDRKEDSSLPEGAIEHAIKDGIITVEEIMEVFRKGLMEEE